MIEVFNRNDQELGAGRLLDIVQSAAKLSTLEISSAEMFAACARHGAQTDDQSLLMVRRASV